MQEQADIMQEIENFPAKLVSHFTENGIIAGYQSKCIRIGTEMSIGSAGARADDRLLSLVAAKAGADDERMRDAGYPVQMDTKLWQKQRLTEWNKLSKWNRLRKPRALSA